MMARKKFKKFKEQIDKEFLDMTPDEKIDQLPNYWKNINYGELDMVGRMRIGILTTLFIEAFIKRYGKVDNFDDLLFRFGINPHWEFILLSAKNIEINRIGSVGNLFCAVAENIKINLIESCSRYNFWGSKDCSVNYLSHALRDFAEFSENFRFNTINKLEEYGFAFSKMLKECICKRLMNNLALEVKN